MFYRHGNCCRAGHYRTRETQRFVLILFDYPPAKMFYFVKDIVCFYIHKTFPSSNYKIDPQQFQMIEIQND